MKNTIYPCLWFDGNAKEAADLYCSVFPDSTITTDTSMVVMFEIGGKKIMGLNGGPQFKINPSISLSVRCSLEETDKIWNQLLEGGKVMMALDKYPWNERYGWLQDKFGMTWQISVADKEGDFSITPCMLFTNYKFGKAQEAINLYTSVFENSSVDMIVHYPDGDVNAGKVMYAAFKLNGYDMTIMDGPGEHNYTFNWAVSLVVECETQQEIDYFWEKLIEDGGEESRCGWLADKFGVSWQIIPSITGTLLSDPEKAPRVMQEVMKMKKLDMAIMMNA